MDLKKKSALKTGWLLAVIMLNALAITRAYTEDPWADTLVEYNAVDPNTGFDTPGKTLGEPVGGGTYAPNNSSLHSIGRPAADPGSYIILKFNTPVTDDQDNPMGLDCIVFGNSFWTGGDPYRKWVEPGIIEISEDVNDNGIADDPWYVIPGSRNLDAGILPEGIPNPTQPLAGNVLNPNTDDTEYDWGYCELTPTIQKYLDNYMRPDDPFVVGITERSGGGDAFDIQWAVPVDGTGNPEGISQFHFIRISAFIDMLDGTFGYITPEIDAVAAVAKDIDEDEDDILDDYEVRVAGTDPTRAVSTVLALEVPVDYGGSPSGTLLGTAHDSQENAITYYSDGTRSGTREYNCIVDIVAVADPAPATPISGLIKSSAIREFQSSVADYETAQIQHALFTIAYTSGEIDGLDEAGLQPYRYDSDFTQDGISSVIKDTEHNLLSFRSQYPGIFILASTAGSGDTDTSSNDFTLQASPTQGTVGEPGTSVIVTSDTIYLPGDVPVADGTFFTLATTLGEITSTDEDTGTVGVQVSSAGGVISFTMQGNTYAGTALVSAISTDGLLHGELSYLFRAGTAVGPVEIYLVDPEATAPGPVAFTTSAIMDAWGNPLDEGTHITLVVTGGAPVGTDAAPGEAGHQLTLNTGIANFNVLVDGGETGETATFTIALYAEPEQTTLLGQETVMLEIVQMPLRIATVLGLLLLCIGIRILSPISPYRKS